MGQFTNEQRRKLNSINERLYDLERRVVPRAKQIDLCAKDIKEAYDHFCELLLSFYSKDELLMRYGQFMNHIDDYFYTENQNEFRNWPTHEMSGEWHCWFYHCLYDHTSLSWDEILTIDRMEGKLRSWYDYTPIDLCLEKLECSEREEYISDASKDQWEQIEKINKALASYQDILIRDAKMLENRLKARVEGGLIEDYAMEFRLVFRLREDDPDYDENDDNFLAIINEPIVPGEMSKKKSRWTQNCNEYFGSSVYFDKKAYFCYLFAAFENNTHINKIKDILRIGSVDMALCWDEYYEI
ncbi:hypothetical protein HMPREF1019_00835 [Campylobacter sp. 10_1_50]|uniref:hypothetical protein n=1 Tax=Campylobacter TaxID=194 RepID=UPI000240FF06|nr:MULTISPECIES: hypothetical protein [Campylobacter]EHL90433.1 hypothetical protein HMPREF1019_00835 [Campylobacter sp. 10_1_50]